MKTLRQIGHAALTRLFNSSRFRPQCVQSGQKSFNLQITFSTMDYDLDSTLYDNDRHDHDSGYHAGSIQMIWGIELGLRYLAVVEEGYTYLEEIVKLVSDPDGPLPSHFIIHNWSRSYIHEDASFVVFRLSDRHDAQLREMRKKLVKLTV